jgi:hypothetical protein
MTTQSSKLMGFDGFGDQRVPVPVRDWNALKLALWRSKAAWVTAVHEADEIISRCGHMEGCAAKEIETEPCLRDCPDRELRMSALVILNAARMFAPADARRPADAPYMAPSREFFSEVLSDLVAAQLELEVLRDMLRTVGIEMPSPPPNPEPKLPTREPPQLASTRLLEAEESEDTQEIAEPATLFEETQIEQEIST